MPAWGHPSLIAMKISPSCKLIARFVYLLPVDIQLGLRIIVILRRREA